MNVIYKGVEMSHEQAEWWLRNDKHQAELAAQRRRRELAEEQNGWLHVTQLSDTQRYLVESQGAEGEWFAFVNGEVFVPA